MKLSAIILTKNEENLIADCIESVSFCDEVLIVDSGSEDRTIEIAQRMKATVVRVEGKDFATLRNIGFEKAKGEWILYVDADERIEKTLANNILKVIDDETSLAAYRLTRKNFYLGNHEWPYREHMERLFRKKYLKRWHGKLHESPIVEGKLGEIDQGCILHFTHRNLTAMLEKTIIWSEVEAKLRYDAHHPYVSWWRFPRVMITAFLDSYVRQGGWKVGTVGLIESIYQAFSMFITYARLWEMQQKKA